MKKLFILAMFLGLSAQAHAATLKEGALYCIDSRKLNSYYQYEQANNNELMEKLLNDSECYIKKRDAEVFVEMSIKSKGFLKLRTEKGFSIWTKKENVVVKGD